ncbi:phage portal protein [Xylanibacillus composti]|uniref:Portal protein n=1 Tax=Xylanibacillus composti TaxID=1572762 RepID=A0A8J4H2C1_9BACL|nr:phage portal protein [Xylanibacillus composti]MDT9723781.1 phage portal protein [Xylanibacillus composti]GIQ67448.1 portal protein [Xylanibacillus composti]
MSLLFPEDQQIEITEIIVRGAKTAASLEDIINIELTEWWASEKLAWMNIGDRYYRVKNDILDRKRTSIDDQGKRVPVENLANNRLANGFVRKLADQKVGYLLGKPLSVQTDKPVYAQHWKEIFTPARLRQLASTGKEAVNKGIAWWFVHYDQEGRLSFKLMKSQEVIPIWQDEAHTVLDAVIRWYEVIVYEGSAQKTITKVEWWDLNGVWRYVYESGGLIPDVEAGEYESHVTVAVKENDEEDVLGMNWDRVPFIAWKYNEEEQPLIELVKSLVDDYDRNKSDNSNNLEDLPESIYVFENYSGTDPGEARKNLSQYRIAFVDGDGGVDTVDIEINTEAYKVHMEQSRKDIYEFGRGVDTQAANFGSAPSGVALRFLYSDLDLDASLMETEFQAALEQVRWFVDTHLYNTTGVDYSSEDVEFIFNKDMPIDEESIIRSIKDSFGILSDETLVAQHPWVRDLKAELSRLREQREKEMKLYPGLSGRNVEEDEEDQDGDEE